LLAPVLYAASETLKAVIDFWPRFKQRARASAWVVWCIGVGVYFLGVFHRSSLGVGGTEALEQLNISSTALGTFVMAQVGIYALMQVPAGLMIDRWGPRRILLAATLTMGSAQLLFAFSSNFSMAFAARVILGAGDAAVFIAVLRLAAEWFPRRRYALLTMITALLGMLGNLVATVPLVLLLDNFGWTKTFLITGATSCVYALLLLRPAVAAPYREPRPTPPTQPAGEAENAGQATPSVIKEAGQNMRASWRQPETRLGFWTHQSTMATGTVISLVWGYPYLTQALDYTNEAAASMLSLYVIANVVSNFIIGPLAGRHPGWRLPLALGTASAVLAGMLTLALWPGAGPPQWVVAVVFALFAAGVPASQIGFHIARDYNPTARIATATGLVNAGGFIGAMVSSLLVGAVLDLTSGGVTQQVGLANYRWALLIMAAIGVISFLAMALSMLRVRGLVLGRIASGMDVVVPVRERVWDRAWRRLTK